MIRILVVLAVLGLAYMLLAGGADKKGNALKPEEQYRQQEQNVHQAEQQLQQQAEQQLKDIDKLSEPQQTEGE
jgi:Tfp pilus assembly protein PilO